jgi:LuxR family maltose regulon positive regulatory protein
MLENPMAEANVPINGLPDTSSQPLLLTTKLYLPPVRRTLVPRPRLIRRLDEGLSHKLTLISAPAGFGKTTLLSEWIPHSQWCVAWVSLDEGDNDPTRFWTYFIAGLQQLDPRLGENALALFQSPQPPPLELCLTTLLNEVATFPEPFALVLDDYHVIENSSLHQALTFLLDHQPPQMHLIITTRADPPLPLSRLRGREQLIELRSEDLRFTPAETMAFFNQVMGLSLSKGDVAALDAHTEGWIAGLQLAALSMQGRDDLPDFIAAFTGSHHFILDYLTDEVLERRPKGTKNFLLQTSILDRLCGPLCDALTGGSDGQATLERLEQANLFLVPLDDERRWYRYHHLFAEVLRSRLVSGVASETITTLYQQAVVWCEAQGLLDEAIRYALAIPDETLAAEILERHAMTAILRSEGVMVRRWLAAIPESVVLARPRLLLRACWGMFTSGAADRVESLLTRGATVLDPAHLPDALKAELLVLQMSLARYRDDLVTTLAISQQASTYLHREPLWLRTIAAQNVGYIQLRHGDVAAGLAALEEVAALDDPSTIYMALTSWRALGRAYARRGSLSRALETTSQAQKLIDRAAGVRLPITGLPDLTAGEALVERNELDAAERALTEGLRLLLGTVAHTHIIPCYVALARVQAARGDMSRALAILDEGETLLQERQVSNHPALKWLVLFRARLLIRFGRLDEAARLVEQPTDTRELATFQRLTQARLILAQATRDSDVVSLSRLKTLLDDELRQAEATGWTRDVIEGLIIRSLTQVVAGKRQEANTDLARALTLAAPERYMRLFLDEGWPVEQLLQRVSQTSQSSEFVNRLLTAFAAEAQGRSQDARTQGRQGAEERGFTLMPTSSGSPALVEPLTERELELLRLVADGYSNQEIAQELFLAIGTVKKHLNNIFGKLGVGSRTQAVARARELDLL